MLYLVRQIRFGRAQPDFDLLSAMVSYIRTFPEQFHHPKEDTYLFGLLRLRNPAIVPLLDRLQAEHRDSKLKIERVEQALSRYRQGSSAEFPEFAAAVAAYAAFHWDHMTAEETEVLPLAKDYLIAEDWVSIDAAFSGHTDPLLGVEAGAEYSKLFRRIVDLAPPPLGSAQGRGIG